MATSDDSRSEPLGRRGHGPEKGGHEGAGPGAVLIVGAGPAGLTAAYELAKRGATCTVFEMDTVVGGLSRTVEREGWRFDIGGHRFFTKVPEVEDLWREILGPEDFLLRRRLSRIYYEGTYYDYPIRLQNALRGLGVVESIRCGLSFLWVRAHPPRDLDTFEGWTARAFGWRLYRKFFKSYTEKIWGMPATGIKADWAAQRIKSLTLGKAIRNAFAPNGTQTRVTSLIDEFHYPRLGPGMMWERAQELVEAQGSKVLLGTRLESIRRSGGRAVEAVTCVVPAGGTGLAGACEPGDSQARTTWPFDHLISSMPLSELVRVIDPPPPADVREAARALRYRDFLTVALVLPAERGFPDNWIYVHSDRVRVGRVQNFGSWSPDLVKQGRTCLGLEYFVFEGDGLWSMPDEDLVALGTRELVTLGLARPGDVERGYVVRMAKAYPVYDEGYGLKVQAIREWLEAEAPNIHPVGRNGMHRYNNQDHSMLTAMLTVEGLYGEPYNTWEVNVEADYHEQQVGRQPVATPSDGAGTGRAVPMPVGS
ncbi:MAG: NAD(P)/FAD-dependent oxidoreductase [Acidimicrobiales bacterium]|jgi:protoporphyrinogen oxidase